MKTRQLHNILITIVLSVNSVVFSQRICEDSKEEIRLSDGISIYVYKERGIENQTYYYVPTALQLSMRDNIPEYSFQEYKATAKASPDGAIFHCLVTWGLNIRQLQELNQCIENKHGEGALLAGAINLESSDTDIHINTSNRLGEILNEALQSKGSAPTISSSKMALSFKIKKEHVVQIRQALKSPRKFAGVSMWLNYTYTTYTCKKSINTPINNKLKTVGILQKWF